MKVKNISVESAKIFFPTDSNWQQLGETRLKNKAGTSAGNIDMVLAALDDNDKVEDFGAMEVQSVYTSGGGLRECFKAYMADTSKGAEFEFGKAIKPDYGSSNRKRLLPQLFSKGFILHTWQKKQAIIIDENFYERLPEFTEVEESKADVVWLIYTLQYNDKDNRYHLALKKKVHTLFGRMLEEFVRSEAGDVNEFIEQLQKKIDKQRKKEERKRAIKATASKDASKTLSEFPSKKSRKRSSQKR